MYTDTPCSVSDHNALVAGRVCDQVWHVGAAASTVQTHAHEGRSAYWWIREGKTGMASVSFCSSAGAFYYGERLRAHVCCCPPLLYGTRHLLHWCWHWCWQALHFVDHIDDPWKHDVVNHLCGICLDWSVAMFWGKHSIVGWVWVKDEVGKWTWGMGCREPEE